MARSATQRRLAGIPGGRVVLARVSHALDPSPLGAWRFRAGAAATRGALVCVYRSRNAARVTPLAEEAARLGLALALWALDEPAPALRAFTVGSGPGLRLRLLNRLCAALPPAATGPLVLSDDDLVFVHGSLGRLLRGAQRCGFDLAQPAHAPGSFSNHAITRWQALSLARRTSFVEIGPLVVVGERWRARILPLPEELGMGWGLDLAWMDLAREGCRLGIVDAVTIRHLSPAGHGYDAGAEQLRMQAGLRARNLRSLRSVQKNLGVWRPWRRHAGWERPAP